MSSRWGRDETYRWPSDKPVWTLTVMVLAVLAMAATAFYQYQRQWTFLQQTYLKTYISTAQNLNAQQEANIAIAKELVNTVTGAINLLGDASALLLGTGTPPMIPELAPSNDFQKVGMVTTSVLLFAIPGIGEAKAPEAIKLAKSLASEAQVAGKATDVIAGFGAKGGKVLRDAGSLAGEYGGKPGEWSKMTSGAYKAADGSVISTHWYERVGSMIKYELKSVIDSAPWSKPF